MIPKSSVFADAFWGHEHREQYASCTAGFDVISEDLDVLFITWSQNPAWYHGCPSNNMVDFESWGKHDEECCEYVLMNLWSCDQRSNQRLSHRVIREVVHFIITLSNIQPQDRKLRSIKPRKRCTFYPKIVKVQSYYRWWELTFGESPLLQGAALMQLVRGIKHIFVFHRISNRPLLIYFSRICPRNKHIRFWSSNTTCSLKLEL